MHHPHTVLWYCERGGGWRNEGWKIKMKVIGGMRESVAEVKAWREIRKWGEKSEDWREWEEMWRGKKKGRREESQPKCERMRGGQGGGRGSGEYRLSGVFYLWSKCTLAFLLSTPQMQLDSSLAKQTQMKWLLNDFLGNPPRQRKPSIWSLLFPSLPRSLTLIPLSSLSLLSPFFPTSLTLIFHPDLCVFLFDLLTFLSLFISTAINLEPWFLNFSFLVVPFTFFLHLFQQVTWISSLSQFDKLFNWEPAWLLSQQTQFLIKGFLKTGGAGSPQTGNLILFEQTK